jgi:predicted deacylase
LRQLFFIAIVIFCFQKPTHAHTDPKDFHYITNRKSYADVVKTLERLALEHPKQVTLFDLGWSDNGVPIKGIRVGNGEKESLLVGTHHGNEYGAAEVSEAFAIDVAQNPIPGQTIYVIPVLNTSGYDKRQRQERNNLGSHDPNRDYPGPCSFKEPFNLRSTKALADFLSNTNVIASATLHTYYPGVLYPWGISTYEVDTGYTDIFKYLGLQGTFLSNYKVGNSTEELYPADGTFEDYAFNEHGIWSLLYELGYSHSPSQKQIDDMIRVNVPGLRKMFEVAPDARAPDFKFKGKCNGLSLLLDRHDE